MTKIPFHQSLAKLAQINDIEVIFGLIGDANLFFVDHFKNGLGGRFVPAVHEASTVLMAMGYAQYTGKLGVATVTHGPGLTNCATALVEAVRTRAPMLLITGDTPKNTPEHLQNIDQAPFVAATGAAFEEVLGPETLAEDFCRALRRAYSEKTVVVLNVPVEFMWEDIEHKEEIYTPPARPSVQANIATLEEAVGMIASSKRPMILAGKGARGAKEPLVSMANYLEIPLATTLKAKDMFRDHPHNLGVFGTLSTPATYEAIAKSDCIICFGASLHYFTTDRGGLLKNKRVIQIDHDPEAISRKYPPDIGIIADTGLTAATILEWLQEAEIPPSGFTPELETKELAHHPAQKRTLPEGTICYEDALSTLNKHLPADRVLVTDGGRFMTEVWCRINTAGPEKFLSSVEFGSIGLGLAQSIGAAVANPSGTTVLFTGDGGFMMGGINELNSAVRLGLNLVIILANDHAYGAEHIQFLDRKMNPELSEFDWPSFESVAKSLGLRGYTADSMTNLQAALEECEVMTGPALIELKLEPTQVPRMRL